MEDDGDDKDDSKRRTRNLSEKKRRDQFNILVNELGMMVSSNNRKMDKSTVLKATISFLKNHNDITVRSRAHDVRGDWKPAFLPNDEFTYLVLEALEGFLMVFSTSGRVHYVSESVASLLGHNPADILDQNIFDLAREDDRARLYALLSMDPTQSAHGKGHEVSFQCHLRRGALDFRDETTYELVQFYGNFRINTDETDGADRSCFQQDNETRVLFACAGCLQAPRLIRDVSLVDGNRSEFTSRHSLEWKFLFLDHRGPPIIGYLPFEVLGTSGYDYYHFEDLEKVVACHEALMEKGELTSCYYRFLTKGQQWIWLQTRFYITYHQWNSKPEFVVCTHRVVSYADVTNSVKTEGDSRIKGAVRTTVCAPAETSQPPDAPSESGLSVPPTALPEGSRLMVGASSETITNPAHSPSCISEVEDAFANYRPTSQCASGKSISSAAGTVATAATATTGPSWAPRAHFDHRQGSDTGSHSGDSRRNSERERENYKESGPPLTPQHVMGVQYLEPSPYGEAAPPVPVSASALVQVQPQQRPHCVDEHLHRKHDELQQMIVRQQAELQQVKEQLLLARLGILPPLVSVSVPLAQVQSPYVTMDEMQQPVPLMQAQIMYEPSSSVTEYPAPYPPHPHQQ